MHRWMIGSGQPRGRGSGGAGFISRYWCQPAVSRAAVIRGYSQQNSIFRDPRLRVVRIHLKIIQAISKLAEVTTEPGPAVMSAYYLVKFWADFAGWVGHKTIRCDSQSVDVSYWTLISIFKNLEPKALFIHNCFLVFLRRMRLKLHPSSSRGTWCLVTGYLGDGASVQIHDLSAEPESGFILDASKHSRVPVLSCYQVVL